MSDGNLSSAFRRLRGALGSAEGADDGELLKRVASARDPAAFELLFWRHGPMVLGVCRRVLRHEQDAEDAFQATFLILLRKAGSVAGSRSLAAWLYRVAHRVALRARAAQRPGTELVDLGALAGTSGETNTAAELRPVLDEELSRLPERFRAPIILCDLQGLTGEEAGRVLGCSRGTVASRLARGRERLRLRLARRGVAPSIALGLAVVSPPAALLARLLSAGTCSPRVVALAQGVLRAMLWHKLERLIGLALVGVLLASGVAVAFRDPPPPPEEKKEAADKDIGGWAFRRTRTPEKLDKPIALALSPDGKTLAAATGGTVRLWDVEKGTEKLTVVKDLADKVAALVFSPDGKELAVGAGEVVRVYEGNELLDRYVQPESNGKQNRSVREVMFAPDGKTVAALVCPPLTEADARAAKGQLPTHAMFWRRDTGKPLHVAVMGNVYSMAFTADGKTLVAGGRAYEILKGRGGAAMATRSVVEKENIQPLPDDAQDHLVMAASPDGKLLATAGSDGKVRLYDFSGKVRWTLDGSGDAVRQLAFDPEGGVLAMADDRRVVLWDVATGKKLTTLEGKGKTQVLRFTGGRTLVAVSPEGVVREWEKKN